MGKKSNAPVKERREKVEEMRRQQAAAERRKTLIFVSVAMLLGLGLIAAVVTPAIIDNLDDPSNEPLTAFGVAAATAGCDAATEDPATGVNGHKPGQTIKYAFVPPSSGEHDPNWADPERKFYRASDRPKMENLVHNLEHGYNVVWYDDTIQGDQLKALEDLSDKFGGDPKTRKFIVSAWDKAYGEFPAGKHIGISHWSSNEKGHRQLCAQVSGEAIGQFVDKYPITDAPEPAAP